MSSHRLDGDPFRFDFTDEFLAKFGFSTASSVATTTEGHGDDDGDVEVPLFSFGSYSHKFDGASFTFSVESYVYFAKKAPSFLSFFIGSMLRTKAPASDKRQISTAARLASQIL